MSIKYSFPLSMFFIFSVFIFGFIGISSVSKAEEKKSLPILTEDMTTDDIIELFTAPSKETSSGLHTKGLSSVEDDESPLPMAPKIGVLIQFEYDSAEILRESHPLLKKIGEALKQLPTYSQILIAGHTDSTGSASYNKKLGERRALSVKNFLFTTHTLSKEQLSAISFGEEHPIAPNNTQEGQKMNRRVEFIRIQ